MTEKPFFSSAAHAVVSELVEEADDPVVTLTCAAWLMGMMLRDRTALVDTDTGVNLHIPNWDDVAEA